MTDLGVCYTFHHEDKFVERAGEILTGFVCTYQLGSTSTNHTNQNHTQTQLIFRVLLAEVCFQLDWNSLKLLRELLCLLQALASD